VTRAGRNANLTRIGATVAALRGTIATRTVTLLALILSLHGCGALGTSPHLDWLADARWQTSTQRGQGFELTVYRPPVLPDGENLHVYLGGDGGAFRSRTVVAADPTGTQHLALQLALADPAPSLFLARPCYYTDASAPPCNPMLWTSHRYAPQVVDAMVAALQQISLDYPSMQLTLVGYSGGGVLAMHIARRLGRVSQVITIAAPLDSHAWTVLHRYSPLVDGSNPADLKDWPLRLEQMHLNGGLDENVPPAVTASFLTKMGGQKQHIMTKTYAEFDHECCWLRDWPLIIAALTPQIR
jgi:hypothetical protein